MNKKIPFVEKVKKTVQKETVSKQVRFYRSLAIQGYMTIGVIVFVILAFFAHMFPYFPIDLAITHSIQSFHPQWFDFLMRFVSYIGYPPQVNIFVGLIVLLLFMSGLRWEAIVGSVNALSITFIGLLIKEVIRRPRPSINLIHVFAHFTETSFPSGHVLFYTAFFGYLWFLAYSLLRKSIQRTLLLFIFAILIILIAPSRIYLGAHWASDTIGAYLFASIWLLVIIKFYHWGKKAFSNKPILG